MCSADTKASSEGSLQMITPFSGSPLDGQDGTALLLRPEGQMSFFMLATWALAGRNGLSVMVCTFQLGEMPGP